MIVDANLLIYAYDEGSPFHKASAAWLSSVMNGKEAVGLPLSAVLAFVRITTSLGLHGRQYALGEVLGFVDDWLLRSHVTLLTLCPEDWPALRAWLLRTSASGKFTSDVQIAVLAAETDATVFSADRDFARFPGIRWINPLDSH